VKDEEAGIASPAFQLAVDLDLLCLLGESMEILTGKMGRWKAESAFSRLARKDSRR